MIKFPIVDAHLHVWDINNINYPWLKDVSMLNKSFLPEDYKKACGDIQVEKMVFLQCECDPLQYKEEVKWVTMLSEKVDNRIQGIVAWAPLEKGEAARAEVEELAQNKLVKGIRRIIQFEPDMEFCLKPDFIKGVQMLPEYDLVFDICIAHQHLENTIKFVEQCPKVSFILDHIGKPNIKDGIVEPWKEEIKILSQFPNVYCKVSSLATEADHQKWTIEDLRPYADHIFDCFGFDRTIYAGDWPVSSQAANLTTCLTTIEELVKGSSESDLKKLFHDNAIKFYKL